MSNGGERIEAVMLVLAATLHVHNVNLLSIHLLLSYLLGGQDVRGTQGAHGIRLQLLRGRESPAGSTVALSGSVLLLKKVVLRTM